MSLKRKRTPIAIPTADSLPHHLRIPSTNLDIYKHLSRLSRGTLCSLAGKWCSEDNSDTCGPYLADHGDDNQDDTAPYDTHESVDEVEELYRDVLAHRKGTKREIVERILDGDWRHGISLKQLAMIETAYVLEHQTALRWAAFRLVPKSAKGSRPRDDKIADRNLQIPQFHAQTFVLALQREIGALAKAHYYIEPHPTEQLTLIRIALHSTPYSTCHAFSATESPKTMFLAFPHSTPYVYVSLPSSVDVSTTKSAYTDEAKSVQRFVVMAVAKALSNPGARFELEGTQLAARGLGALLKLRGNGRTNNSAGGWSVYTGDGESTASGLTGSGKQTKARQASDLDKENLPLSLDRIGGCSDLQFLSGKSNPKSFQHSKPTAHMPASERQEHSANTAGRFGDSALPNDEAAIQRFDVKIEDPFTAAATSRGVVSSLTYTPSIKLSFQGSHVFAGLRQLAEAGIIKPAKMPSWMTGETGVSVGVVSGGRMQGFDVLEEEETKRQKL